MESPTPRFMRIDSRMDGTCSPKQVADPVRQKWIDRRWQYRIRGKKDVFDCATSRASTKHFCAIHLHSARVARLAGRYFTAYRCVRMSAKTRAMDIEEQILDKRTLRKDMVRRWRDRERAD